MLKCSYNAVYQGCTHELNYVNNSHAPFRQSVYGGKQTLEELGWTACPLFKTEARGKQTLEELGWSAHCLYKTALRFNIVVTTYCMCCVSAFANYKLQSCISPHSYDQNCNYMQHNDIIVLKNPGICVVY